MAFGYTGITLDNHLAPSSDSLLTSTYPSFLLSLPSSVLPLPVHILLLLFSPSTPPHHPMHCFELCSYFQDWTFLTLPVVDRIRIPRHTATRGPYCFFYSSNTGWKSTAWITPCDNQITDRVKLRGIVKEIWFEFILFYPFSSSCLMFLRILLNLATRGMYKTRKII